MGRETTLMGPEETEEFIVKAIQEKAKQGASNELPHASKKEKA